MSKESTIYNGERKEYSVNDVRKIGRCKKMKVDPHLITTHTNHFKMNLRL